MSVKQGIGARASNRRQIESDDALNPDFRAPSDPDTHATVGTVGGETTVNVVTAGQQVDPRITYLDDGRFVVVWSSNGGATGLDAIGRIFNANGTAFGAEFIINTGTAGNQELPDVTALADGGFAVTWLTTVGGQGDLRAQVYSVTGAAVTGEITVTDHALSHNLNSTQSQPVITGLSGGRFAVAWTDLGGADGSGLGVRTRVYNADGSPVGAESGVNTTIPDAQQLPAIARAGTGYIVTWQDGSGAAGQGVDIRAQLFDLNGAKVGSEILVTSTVSTQERPAVVELLNGNFAIAWQDISATAGDASSYSIKARIVSSTGTLLGSELLLNTSTAGIQLDVALARLVDGGFVATFSDYGQNPGDTSGSAVRSRTFDANGAPTSAERLVNTTITGNQIEPAVAADGLGNYAVAFRNDAGGTSDISVQRFAVSQTATVFNTSNVGDTAALRLAGVYTLTTATAGGNSFVIAGGFEDGVTVLQLAGGVLTPVFSLPDSAGRHLVDVAAAHAAVIAGVTYVYIGGFENGFSAFRLEANGSLTLVQDVSDTAGSALQSTYFGITTAEVGGTTYLYVSSYGEGGITAYRVGAGGALTQIGIILDSENGTYRLSGVADIVPVTVGGNQYLLASSPGESAVNVLRINADGTLTFVSAVADDATLRIGATFTLATAVVGGATYVYVAGLDDNGLSVFSLSAAGTLTNIQNIADDAATRLFSALNVTTFTADGRQYVAVGGSENGVTLFLIGGDGRLIFDQAIVDTPTTFVGNEASVASIVANGATYLVTTSSGNSGVSAFQIGQAAPPNTAPTLTDLDAATFDENTVNATPQLLDATVTFADADNNFSGGAVTVSGLLAEDRVAIRNEGTAAGQIGVSGSNVAYGGVTIGTVAGGAGATLTVTLNASATAAAVDALIQNLTYANVSDTPTASRTLTINVTDAAGTGTPNLAVFTALTGANNPFSGLFIGSLSDPDFLDIDGDGDLDLVVGEQTSLQVYRNNGVGTAYTELTGSANPFNGLSFGADVSPSFVDLDGDGDLDAVIGNFDGQLIAVRNNGTGAAFTLMSGAANPYNGINFGTNAAAAFIDFDGDGDLDTVTSSTSTALRAFRNNGNGVAVTELTGAANPFNSLTVPGNGKIGAFDFDYDGDRDLVLAPSDAGPLQAYRNNGAGQDFTALTGAGNPFNGISTGSNGTIGFGDFDRDGDTDFVLGATDGSLSAYSNAPSTGKAISVTVTAQNDAPTVAITPPPTTTGSETRVNSFVTNAQTDPSVAALSGGGHVVVWTSTGQDGSGTSVHMQRYNAAGATVGSETQVNTNVAGTQNEASVAALNGGGYVVTWTSALSDGDGQSIRMQRFDANGGTLGSETLVNTTTAGAQSLPSVSALADGGYVIVWQDPNAGINGQRYNSVGVAQGAQFTVSAVNQGDQFPSVVGLAGGGFTVTWFSLNDGSGQGVNVRRYDASGVAQGAAVRANTFTISDQSYSSIGALTDGGYIVAWESLNQDGSGYGVYAQRYSAAGATVGGEFRVNTVTANGQEVPTIAGLADGGFVITWRSSAQDGAGFGAYGQRYDAAGQLVGGEFRINTTTLGDQINPAVAALPGSGFVVAWSGNGPGDGGGVFSQSYTTGFTATEGVALSLKGGVIPADADAGTGVVNATLSVAYGVLNVAVGTSGATIVSGNGTGSVVVSGTIAQLNALLNTNATSTVTYTANTDAPPGSTTFTVSVNDGGATGSGGAQIGSDSETIAITAVNDEPSGADATLTVSEDGARAFTAADFGFSDVDGGSLAFVVITTLPMAGMLTLSGVAVTAGQAIAAVSIPDLVFAPAASANGTSYANFTFQVRDNGATGGANQNTDQSPNTITFNVTAVNDAPVLDLDANGSGTGYSGAYTEGGAAAAISDTDVLITDVDAGDNIEGATITIANAVAGDVLTVIGALPGSITIDPSSTATNLILTGTGTKAQYEAAIEQIVLSSTSPDPTAGGTNTSRTINVSVTDGDASSNVAVSTISVADDNADAPSGTSSTITAIEDTFRLIQLSDLGFSDPDGTFASVTISAVTGGGIYFDADGSAGAGVPVLETLPKTYTVQDLASGKVSFKAAPNANGAGLGTITFAVRDDDGNADGSPNVLTVDVTPVNDAPTNFGTVSITVIEDTPYTMTSANFTPSYADADGDAFAGVRITMLPTSGSLLYDADGAGSGAATVVTLNQVISKADIDAGKLTFVTPANANNPGAGLYSFFDYAVQDASGAFDVTPDQIQIGITPINDAPVLDLNGAGGGVNASLAYTENGPAAAIAPAALFTDPDSTNANYNVRGAVLTVSFTANGTAADQLGIVNAGIGAGQIGTSGSNVTYGGVTIGTFSGGANGATLTITLNSSASTTPAALEELMQSISFANSSDTPSSLERTVSFSLNDNGGTAGGGQNIGTATASITVTAVDDPGIAGADSGSVADNSTTVISVLTNDGDVDGPPPSVAQVNGAPIAIGGSVLLASGARVTRNADGTLTYDTNGAFESLAAAGNGGVSATSDVDSFTYTLAGGGAATVNVTVNGIDNNDFILGAGGDDTLFGGVGNDTINALGGDDRLYGGTGADTMNGGAGNDIYIVDDAADTLIEAANEGLDSVFTSVNWTLAAEFERLGVSDFGTTYAIDLTGNGVVNEMWGNDGANVLDGGGDADIMNGFAGDDTYRVNDAGDVVVELLNEGTDTVSTTVSYTIAHDIERLLVTDAASTGEVNLTGNELANELTGNAGANWIDGGAGADMMAGLGGNDIYFADDAGDTIVETSGGGLDTVFTSVGMTLSDEVERLGVNGIATTFAIDLTGNGLANEMWGNDGANVIDGKAGADIMFGYGGDDTFYVDNAGDQIVELLNQGTDTVITSVSYTLNHDLEKLAVDGASTTFAINLTGNELDNEIDGNDGANTIDGGAGVDTMTGLGGNDFYIVDDASDAVVEASGGGLDTVFTSVGATLGDNVERLGVNGSSTSFAIDLAGNALDNEMWGNDGANVIDGKSGADIVFGYGGADTFAFTTALGANNVDQLVDFTAGADTIALDDAVFAGLTTGTLAAGAFHTGSAAADADDRIIYDSITGALYFDADGSGSGAQVQFAVVHEGLSLAASDFSVI